jgi:hypothetical protein
MGHVLPLIARIVTNSFLNYFCMTLYEIYNTLSKISDNSCS